MYYIAVEELPSVKVNSNLELQRLNGLQFSYKNLSSTTITEIQQCISTVIQKEIVQNIKQSSVYDESTDITVDKLSVCVRYVLNGVPKTQFLSNVQLENGKAHTIVNSLTAKIEELQLDSHNTVTLVTDGAAVLMGRKAGVGVQVKIKVSPLCHSKSLYST